jgi:hypothetical protein
MKVSCWQELETNIKRLAENTCFFKIMSRRPSAPQITSILNIFIAHKLLTGPYETIDTYPYNIIYKFYMAFFATSGVKKA